MATLPKRERLRGRDRIGELFEKGSRGVSGPVAARALANDLGITRVAAVAGKKIGNAVKRNALRRRIRAAFRMQKAGALQGMDLALIARPGLLEASWQELMDAVQGAMAKAARGLDPGRPHR